MTFKFSSLPNEIIVYLFNANFCLQELFHLRGLSHRLQLLIECCISKRKSLKLFWSIVDVHHYTICLYYWMLEDNPTLALKNQFDDDLILCEPKFTQSTADWLARMFPRLAHLLILFNARPLSHPSTQHYPVLPYLISSWPSTLDHLTLFGYAPSGIPDQTQLVGKLYHVINESLPSLKQLDLCAQYLFFYVNPNKLAAFFDERKRFVFIPMELSDRLLNQLERLNLGTQLPLNAPEKMLDKLGDGSTKLHIKYTYCKDFERHLAQLSGAHGSKSRNSARAVTHMSMSASLGHWHTTVLDCIVSHFTGLRSLALDQANLYKVKQPDKPVMDILCRLTNLRYLIELSLRNFDLTQLRDINEQQTSQTVCLLTVTHLTIIENVFDPPHIGSLGCALLLTSIRNIFPSVRSLRLKLEQPLSEPIYPVAQLAPFRSLTRFELTVYQRHVAAIPHIFSVKHVRLFEAEFLQAQQHVDRIGVGQAGRELWTRRQRQTSGLYSNRDDEKMNNFEWIKSTVVYDAHRLHQIGRR